MAPTKPSTSAATSASGLVPTGDQQLPINSQDRDAVQKWLASLYGKKPEEVKGIRIYTTAAVKLSEVVVLAQRAWLENPTCSAVTKSPSLDQLLAPPKPLGIQVIVTWKDGKPVTKDYFVSQILPWRMRDFWVSLTSPVGGNTKVQFTPPLPLLNGKANSAHDVLVAAVKQCHKGEPWCTPLQVEPVLVGESEADLLKRRAARLAK